MLQSSKGAKLKKAIEKSDLMKLVFDRHIVFNTIRGA